MKPSRSFLSKVTMTVLSVFFLLYFFMPLQRHMGMNLVAVLEPYIPYDYYLLGLKGFMAFFVNFLLLPFYIVLSYRLSKVITAKLAARFSARKENAQQGQEEKETYFHKTFVAPASLAHQKVQGWIAYLKTGLRGFFRHNVVAVHLRRRRGRGRGLGRLVGAVPSVFKFGKAAYMVFCIVMFLFEAIFFLQAAWAMASRPNATVAIARTCSRCHSVFRPLNYNRTSAVWETTLDRMLLHYQESLEMDNAGFYSNSRDPEQGIADESDPLRHTIESFLFSVDFDRRDIIVDWLIHVRGYSDKRLIRSKCFTCHTPFRIFSTPRTATEWEHLVERISRQNTFYITWRQRDQIVHYLQQQDRLVQSQPDASLNAEKKNLFEHKCAACHTLDIVLMPHIKPTDWEPCLKRMGQKQPDFLTPQESLSLLDLAKQIVSEKELFFERFPHSTRWEQPNE